MKNLYIFIFFFLTHNVFAACQNIGTIAIGYTYDCEIAESQCTSEGATYEDYWGYPWQCGCNNMCGDVCCELTGFVYRNGVKKSQHFYECTQVIVQQTQCQTTGIDQTTGEPFLPRDVETPDDGSDPCPELSTADGLSCSGDNGSEECETQGQDGCPCGQEGSFEPTINTCDINESGVAVCEDASSSWIQTGCVPDGEGGKDELEPGVTPSDLPQYSADFIDAACGSGGGIKSNGIVSCLDGSQKNCGTVGNPPIPTCFDDELNCGTVKVCQPGETAGNCTGQTIMGCVDPEVGQENKETTKK